MSGILYALNDNIVRVEQAHAITETGDKLYLGAGALVECALTDMQDVPIAGEVWPLVLEYVPGSQGDFEGVLRDTLELPQVGDCVKARFTIDNGPDQRAVFTTTFVVHQRDW
jgi:hypothetical protein